MICSSCGKETKCFHHVDGKAICPDCPLPIVWTEEDQIIAHTLRVSLEAA